MWFFETIFASQLWSLRCYLSMNSFQCWRNSLLISMNSFTGEGIQTETGIPLLFYSKMLFSWFNEIDVTRFHTYLLLLSCLSLISKKTDSCSILTHIEKFLVVQESDCFTLHIFSSRWNLLITKNSCSN